ncbi:hypothetical protein EGR_07160 [Echinococcus granulosus]|uniref:Uncharacterized protein n=1 Tax=Echinococcus granulosus TaxID=6210 RepID=W6U9C9_ECHGR|nr:hypothetical protein EGR_07160 [Echinococcus granulosus]EUB57968.1 hypothetical protein EGR_07160 [Echinococcus granulosus]
MSDETQSHGACVKDFLSARSSLGTAAAFLLLQRRLEALHFYIIITPLIEVS